MIIKTSTHFNESSVRSFSIGYEYEIDPKKFFIEYHQGINNLFPHYRVRFAGKGAFRSFEFYNDCFSITSISSKDVKRYTIKILEEFVTYFYV